MLHLMILRDISLEEISLENESFRISEELDSDSVRDSLSQVGQLNPVILLDRKPQMAIVCGFRRVRALKQLGMPRVFARILPEKDIDISKTFELALWDNLSHRQLDPLEKARVLFKLKHTCDTPDHKLISVYLPILGLAPNNNVLRNYLLLNEIHPDLRRCLIEGRLTHSSLEYLAELPTHAQEYMASFMSRIRLSASLQKKLLSLLDDLGAQTGAAFDSPLGSPQMMAILEDAGLSPFQKGEKIYDSLYRFTHPRLSETIDRFAAQRRRLNLPGSIQVNAHPFFEEPGVRVEFHAASIDKFRQLAAALQGAAQSPELEKLFQLD